MTHIHGCLNCKPDMVPEFDKSDRRYHGYKKCGVVLEVKLDGVIVSWTSGVFEGNDGWILFNGNSIDEMHYCPNCTVWDANGLIEGMASMCVEPRFGVVSVVHSCPANKFGNPIY